MSTRLVRWEPRWAPPVIESACPSCGRVAERTSGAWSSKTDGTLQARMSCGRVGHEDQLCYRTWDERLTVPVTPAAPVVQGADELREALIEGLRESVDDGREEHVADWLLALPEVAQLLADAAAGREMRAKVEPNPADQMYLDSIRTENGQIVIDAHGAEQTLAHMALAMRTFFEANGDEATNYIQSGVIHEGKTWNFVVYPAGKPTPHDLRRKAEAERDEALAKVERVRAWVASMDDLSRQYREAAAAVTRPDLAAEAAGHAEDVQASADGVRRALDGEAS